MISKMHIERFQRHIKTLRAIAGVSQTDVAQEFFISNQAMCNIEAGRTKMSAFQFVAINKFLEDSSPNKDLYRESYRILVLDDKED